MCAIMGYTERDIPMSQLEAAFAAAKSRGPDDSRSLEVGSGSLLFHRLAIMGPEPSGMQPFTKESLLYREIFEKHYPGQAEMVVDFWMPNKEWEGCDVNDPSARVLSNYGASGE